MFKEILSGAVDGIKALGSTLRKTTCNSDALSNMFNVATVAALLTWSSNPAFSGTLLGVGKAALVGLGTAVGGSVGGILGMVGGAVAASWTGAFMGLLTTPFIKGRDNKVDAVLSVGAILSSAGVLIGGFGGYGVGVVKSHDALVKYFEDKKINTTFNDTVSGKKIEIDRKNFTATIKTPKSSL